MADKDKKNGPIQDGQKTEPARPTFREWIGLITIGLSGIILIVLIIVSGFHITAATPVFTNIKELFAILLPVIGTWVGTVLAYYFSKENFEAASRSVSELVGKVTSTDEKLQELKVTDIMLQTKDFTSMMVDNYDAYQKTKILDLHSLMVKTNSERIPFLQKDLKFIFLIYRLTVERFMLGYKSGAGTIKLKDAAKIEDKDLTIKDMFDSDFQLTKDISALNIDGIFLPETATLAQARQKMQDNTICQDVFITKTGSKDEAVLGWITNYLIVEKAELFKKAGTRT